MSLDMRATILVAALSRAHNPTRSWWADTQHDRAAFRAALAERLPHLPLTDFGRRAGQGITAPDVPVSRTTRVPLPDDETGRRGPAREG
jgi:hypothetical protein